MASTNRLYDLQTVDLEIAAKSQALQDVEARLGEGEALPAARASLAEAQASLKDHERRRRDVEIEIEDIGARRQELEKKLYGGSVRSSKELLEFQTEVANLKALISQKEDTLLECMEATEEAQRHAGSAQADLASAEAAWRQEQEELLRQQQTLRERLAALQAQREERAAALDPRSISLYEALRASKQGRAVALVTRGACQACRVGLPMAVVQRARSGLETVTCSSCGRILHVA